MGIDLRIIPAEPSSEGTVLVGIEVGVDFRTDCLGCLDGAEIEIQRCGWESDPRRQDPSFRPTGFDLYFVQRREFFGAVDDEMVRRLAEEVRKQVFWINDANVEISEAAAELQEFVDDIAAEWRQQRRLHAA